MRTILKNLDADIHEAGSGNQALALSVRHDFALVLLDVQMPEMDGFEVAGLMWENEPTANVPVIFVTANSDVEILEQVRLVQPYGYLIKPYRERELRAKIEIALYKIAAERELALYRDHLETLARDRTAELRTKSHPRLAAAEAPK